MNLMDKAKVNQEVAEEGDVFQLLDELRLALQASIREKKQMEEALKLIKKRTAFHTLTPLKQINEVNEIACKALGVYS